MKVPWKKIGFGGLIVVVVVMLIWPSLWHQRTLALTAFQGYSTAISHGDYRTAYSYFANELKQTTPFESFVKQQEGLEARFGPLSTVTRQGWAIHERGSPIVRVITIQADHHYVKRTVRFVYVWHREDGRWVLWSSEQQN
ncbi:MAG: nuclear transport factor 2 family protein [Terriglobales bacterium]